MDLVEGLMIIISKSWLVCDNISNGRDNFSVMWLESVLRVWAEVDVKRQILW